MKINFLPDESEIEPDFNRAIRANDSFSTKKESNFSLAKLIITLAIIFIIIFAGLASILAFSKNQIFDNLSKMNIFGQVGQFITSQDKKLVGEEQDRVNFLLMGMGGKTHEGGLLTDTIIMVSYKPSTNQIAMMSIPRDLYVKADGYGWNKINAINVYAEKNKEGSGGEELAKTLSQVLDLEIPYYVAVDFDGFEKLIDEFGGVDVVVDNDLIDYQYPIRGREDAYPISSRFEKLVIKKGQQHLDGQTALKFSRSRHALGSEGSDFARSKRQQKIIAALKDKVISSQTLLSPGKISKLLSTYNENVYTNMQLWELLRTFNLTKGINTNEIIQQQLSDSGSGMLYSQKINGAYVLLPTGGSYAKIKAVWENIFTSTSTDFKVMATNEDADLAQEIEKLNAQSKKENFSVVSSTKTTTTPTSSAPSTSDVIDQITDQTDGQADYQLEQASIEIRNGTTINGWATQEKNKLLAKKFTISQTGNAPTREYKNIFIYDLSNGSYLATARELSSVYGVSVLKTAPPFTSNASFLIILGK